MRRSECRACREQLGWTQKELAAFCALSESSIRNFESGRNVPYPRVMERIEQTFQAAGASFNGPGEFKDIKRERMLDEGCRLLGATVVGTRQWPDWFDDDCKKIFRNLLLYVMREDGLHMFYGDSIWKCVTSSPPPYPVNTIEIVDPNSRNDIASDPSPFIQREASELAYRLFLEYLIKDGKDLYDLDESVIDLGQPPKAWDVRAKVFCRYWPLSRKWKWIVAEVGGGFLLAEKGLLFRVYENQRLSSSYVRRTQWEYPAEHSLFWEDVLGEQLSIRKRYIKPRLSLVS